MNANSSSPTIGLALGGGGARGLAHIGVLQVLEREGIPVHVLAGTSMGGIISAFYASGMTPAEMEAEVLRVRARRNQIKLLDLTVIGSGLVKGKRVQNYLSELIGSETTFADLKLPIAFVAADLTTGLEVVLNQGRVVDALRATISVPGVFEPVVSGESRLVDGGVLNNVPVEVTRSLGADIVIAVDVVPNFQQTSGRLSPMLAYPLKPGVVPRSFWELIQVEMIMISALTHLRIRCTPPDVLINPDLPGDLGMFLGFQRPEVAIPAGVAAAEAALPRIRAAIDLAKSRAEDRADSRADGLVAYTNE
jgi:NTE family protein